MVPALYNDTRLKVVKTKYDRKVLLFTEGVNKIYIGINKYGLNIIAKNARKKTNSCGEWYM